MQYTQICTFYDDPMGWFVIELGNAIDHHYHQLSIKIDHDHVSRIVYIWF